VEREMRRKLKGERQKERGMRKFKCGISKKVKGER